MEKRVIVIVGPTCSGKTNVGIQLAKKLNTEIISADSRQIYKLLSIGTAKPSNSELAIIKHYFIDELDPAEEFNVSKFENEADEILETLTTKDKIPIVVGGSGLYIKAVIDGIMDVDVDEDYRKELLELKEKKGNEYIYKILRAKDPKAAETMLPQNWKRVIRALEVFYITGKSILDFHNEQQKKSQYNFSQFGIIWPREILYKNIEKRVDNMIRDGLVEEVKSILDKGYTKELNSLNTVGYKEIIAYLQGEYDLDRAIELIKRNTRRFAKRQLTWFRKDDRIEWINVENERELNQIDSVILDKINKV